MDMQTDFETYLAALELLARLASREQLPQLELTDDKKLPRLPRLGMPPPTPSTPWLADLL